MQPCPQCQTLLEPWEVLCHSCGKVILLEPVPVVADVSASETGLNEALQDWLAKGKEAMARQDFEEAAVCFQRALSRGKGLPDSREREMAVRALLGEALEKNRKLAEAAEQYRVIVERSPDLAQRQEIEKKVKTLQDAVVIVSYVASGGESFQAAEVFELKVVPLYCGSCKRRLTEGELYGFRKGLMKNPRCLCGYAGAPLVKRTLEHVQTLKEEEGRTGRKKLLIEAASGSIERGKNRTTAALLAIFLGAVGAHKFYLGERGAGIWSLVFCWTFIPWLIALFEATQLLTMSDVSFNLAYNVPLVLQRIPPESEPASEPADGGIFSMEITEDPEDFVDELSQ